MSTASSSISSTLPSSNRVIFSSDQPKITQDIRQQEIERFQSLYKEVVCDTKLDDWTSPRWKELIPHITKNVVNAAWSKRGKFTDVFDFYGPITFVPTDVEQIQTKVARNYLDVISKLLSLRIECKKDEMEFYLNQIIDTTTYYHGLYSHSSKVQGEFKKRAVELRNVYVYLQAIGYPIRIQIIGSYTERD